MISVAVLGQRGSMLWRADERVVITDYRTVEAVAADETLVYAVSRGGICVYDHRFRRWEPPVATSVLGEWVAVRDAAVDPIDGSLWVGTDRGLVNYQPRVDWLEETPLPGGAAALWIDPRDPLAGIYFRGLSGWEQLPRGGAIPVPANPPRAPGGSLPGARVRAILERYPSLATLSGRVLTDDHMRTFRFTSGAEVPSAGAVFLGTDGMGLLRFDITTTELERLPFGLHAEAATTIQLAEGGVWVGGSDRGGWSSLSFVSSDLQHYEYVDGPPVTGLAGTVVNDLLHIGSELWLATDAGVTVLADGRQFRKITGADGLPAGQVLALAAAAHDVVVGTERGVARVTDTGVERLGEATVVRVNDLTTRGDSLWVASASGLGWSLSGSDRVLETLGAGGVPELSEEIVAVTFAGDVLAAATRHRLLWRVPSSSDSWIVERPVLGELGEITALGPDVGGVWIGGARGFALYRLESRQFRFFSAPDDVPGRVWDLATDERFLWVATDGGLVRFDLNTVSGER